MFFWVLGDTSTVFELNFCVTKLIFPMYSYEPCDPDDGGAPVLLFGEYNGPPN